MNPFRRTSSHRTLHVASALALAIVLLLTGPAFGQAVPAENPPEGAKGPLPGDTRSPGEECEDHDDDGDCDPIYAALGTLVAEYLPHITDGARTSHGWMPGGGAHGGRLEWTLHRSQGRRLMLGVGAQAAPVRALQPEAEGRPFQPRGRDGAFALTLGGSGPLGDLGLPAECSFRGVAETTLLVGDPGRQLRLTIGPRYRIGLDQNALTVDLVVGTNLGTEGLAPRVGLRIGWTWD